MSLQYIFNRLRANILNNFYQSVEGYLHFNQSHKTVCGVSIKIQIKGNYFMGSEAQPPDTPLKKTIIAFKSHINLTE